MKYAILLAILFAPSLTLAHKKCGTKCVITCTTLSNGTQVCKQMCLKSCPYKCEK